jgi:hypothetical protein
MRVLSAAVAGFVVSISGCAAITGLQDYGEGSGSGSGDTALSHPGDAGTVTDPDAGAASGDDADDGSLSSSPDGDATWIVDAGEFPDIDLDAPPVCGPSTCQGCCMNGTCVGGASVDTCGSGGGLCTDCTSKGGACSKGACATPVVDAAPPPMCKASSCGSCIPFYQTGCCKSDNTCGCEVSFSNSCK